MLVNVDCFTSHSVFYCGVTASLDTNSFPFLDLTSCTWLIRHFLCTKIIMCVPVIPGPVIPFCNYLCTPSHPEIIFFYSVTNLFQ